ncbi:MAG: hypothetical protein JWN85_4813 [Gammaproteobacteria bacterium]|nr:hypothetical protein [Gammaproteobacteria bacterium]
MSGAPLFGQPLGGIMQVAYVVPNLREAMALWTSELRVGPFFLFENFQLDELQHRGRAATLHMSLACAYSGSMCFELIEQHDTEPSVYRDVIVSRGYGFHHWARSTQSFDADVRRYESSGAPLAMYGVATVAGARVAYMDAREKLGGMVELIELTPAIDSLFGAMKRAAEGWDGSHPIRTSVA